MKKIAAVFVLALVAMTAVFAATNKTSDLTVKLSVDSVTEVAFTNKALSSSTIETGDLFDNNEFEVTADSTHENQIWASFVSTCKSPITISVSVEKPLTNGTETIDTTLSGKTSYTESAAATAQRYYSLPVTLVIGSDEGKLAGDYEGTLKLTVTAND
ncbi:MAG: hypothetical protein ACI4NM_11145 [Bullifex sp.]